MTGVLDMGPEELRRRLEDFDRAVCLLHPGRSFRLIIVGGGALVLMGCISRSTSDLDALSFPPELRELMEQYDINGKAKAYEDEFAYSFEDRIQPIDADTKAVQCFAASLEDVVIAKLHSPRDQDAEDIRDPGVLRMLDWERLDELAQEMGRQVFIERRHEEFKISYEQYRKECSPCDR
ncbi:MAG: DUF6036 family nucleotidyltransferase [Coriobacteriia bacterium]|nr:DUF6036 family nucleotidyltransferase [Coriobacteriia bacterium]